MQFKTHLIATAILATAVGPVFGQAALTNSEVMEIHDDLLALDTHVDIGANYGTHLLDPAPTNGEQVNLPGMRIGDLDAAFFVVYTCQGERAEEGYAEAKAAAGEKYLGILRMLRANSDTIGLATTVDEVEALDAEGKLVALVGIENSYPLGATPKEVRSSVAEWAERGARYASITHFGHNQFGGSSNPSSDLGDGEDPGLTDLGRELVSALNEHGIMVEISHAGQQTAADAMAASTTPVIASHSTAKAVYDNPRGLSDEQFDAIREAGGVAQITAYRSYIGDVDPRITKAIDALRERLDLQTNEKRRAAAPEVLVEYEREIERIREEFDDTTLAKFLDHVDHAVEVADIDHVGLSGDFDGGGGVEGWDGAAASPNVTAALMERGYSEEDLVKIWGGNLLRVMSEVQSAAEAQ